MATLTLKKPFCISPTEDVRIDYLPEASSQSFEKNEFVYLASGKVTACASNAAACWGLALAPASGNEDTLIPVLRATPNTEFVVCVGHATPADAITAITQRGGKYGLGVAAHIATCDIDDSSNLFFHVQDIHQPEKEAMGDEYGRVVVKILTDIAQAGPGEKASGV